MESFLSYPVTVYSQIDYCYRAFVTMATISVSSKAWDLFFFSVHMIVIGNCFLVLN